MDQPLVGIAVAAYKPNIDFFIPQLESIIGQLYGNWFCVITFDSSLDELKADLRLAKYFSDSRFSWFENEKQLGVTKNFEAAIQRCLQRNPKYIACADQDDVWLPQKLSRSVQLLRSLPSMSVVHSDMRILKRVDDSEQFELLPQTAWQIERRGVSHVSTLDLMIRNVVAGAGMMMDAELVRQFPTIPAAVCEHDHWYPLVASFFGGVHAIHEALYHYRIHGANITGLGGYQGFFARSASVQRLGIINKLLLNANSTAERFRALRQVGLPVSQKDALVTQPFIDLGVGFTLKGLYHLNDDPALARACLSRAAGKLLRFAFPRFTSLYNR